MPTVTFRRPQVEAQQAVRAMWAKAYKENIPELRNALVSLPTGVGKTCCASKHVFESYSRGQRVLWIAHRWRLLTQARDAFVNLWDVDESKVGFVKEKYNDVKAQVCFAMTNTLYIEKRIQQYLAEGVPDLVVYDEVHHAPSPSNQKILNIIDAARIAAKGAPAFKLGLTATVERADGRELGSYWTRAYSCSLLDAMDPPEEWNEDPYLVPFVSVMERLQGLVLPKKKGNDYDDDVLGHALLLAGVVQHTVRTLEKHAKGKRPLVFCSSVEHAQETAKGLSEAGWSAACVVGTTGDEERESIMSNLEHAPIEEKPCLINMSVCTEGTDLPRCDCVVIARPTGSKSLYQQMLGRGLRLYPGKKQCLIIDIAGASQEHDLITAPVLLEDLEKERTKRSKKEPAGSRPDALNGLGKARRRVEIDWLEIPGIDKRVFAVEAGDVGTVALIQDSTLKHSDLWTAVWISKGEKTTKDGKAAPMRPVEPLSHRPVDLTMATALGTDIARRALNRTGKNAKELRGTGRPSLKQRDLLFRLYSNRKEELESFNLARMTATQVQDLIDKDTIARLLERKNLVKILRHVAVAPKGE